MEICNKGAYLVGRSPICDIMMDHLSTSRQHAVIQHRGNGNCYMYDLGSTHGTFINKLQVKPKVYVLLKSGDLLRFGESTRMYVLGGGPELEQQETQDQEDTPQEVGDVFTGNEEEMEAYLHKHEHKNKKQEDKKEEKVEEEIEDIDEDDESQRRFRIIEEEDYGIDDDAYYDRTGQIEKKKKLKERRKAQNRVETYDTLMAKKGIVENQRNSLLQEIQELDSSIKTSQEAGDSLDSYMDSLSTQLDIDKRVKKQKLVAELDEELARLLPLIAIVRPALAPLEKKPETVTHSKAVVEFENTLKRKKLETDAATQEIPTKKPRLEPGTISKGSPTDDKKHQIEQNDENKESIETDASKNEVPSQDIPNPITEEQPQPVSMKKKKKRRKKQKYDDDINYEDWIPPVNQTGDGKTRFNDVFGY